MVRQRRSRPLTYFPRLEKKKIGNRPHFAFLRVCERIHSLNPSYITSNFKQNKHIRKEFVPKFKLKKLVQQIHVRLIYVVSCSNNNPLIHSEQSIVYFSRSLLLIPTIHCTSDPPICPNSNPRRGKRVISLKRGRYRNDHT